MTAHALPLGDTSVEVRLHCAARAVSRLVPPPRARSRPPELARAARAAVDALPDDARTVCLVVPDRTRDARLPAVLPPLLEALAARGLAAAPPPCVFASGTHAPMSVDEQRAALGDAVHAVRPLPHDCDAADLVALAGGRGARVHPEVARADAVLVVGALSWHYLAGFGGGRKMLLPGVSDRATATAVHETCLLRDPPGRDPLARPGVLDDNPLHRAIVSRLGALLPRAAGLSVVVEGGRVVDVEGGPLLEHHARLAERFRGPRTVTQEAPLDGVVLSCGGSPYDVDLVQAHKALYAIAPLLREGARVAWLASLPRGLGHARMREWLTTGTPASQLAKLLEDFVIGEQTAWSLRTLLARFEVGLVSTLDDDLVRALGMTPLAPPDVDAFVTSAGPRLAVAPHGAAYLYLRS